MVKPMLRTRARKKVKTRIPGGKTVIHYKEGKHSKRTCGRCESILDGVASASSSGMQKISKSEKVPTRSYAGVLCPACVEDLFRYQTRFTVKASYPDYANMEFRRDLTLERFLPKGWYAQVSKK